MSKLQLIDAKTMEKLLLKIGFTKIRQKGIHAFFLKDL
jgi:predicted RNA binding protein YcfA (HicA-like mRNA interferase family)